MSFILLILYLFCTIIRPQDWMPGFYGLRLVNTLSILSIVFLILERLATRKQLFARVPQNWMMIGLFLSVCMSHIVHTYMEGLSLAFQDFVVFFILFFVMLNGINGKVKFKLFLWLFVGMVFPLVYQGIFQMQHGYGWAGQNITFDFHRQESRINWIGIFNDPNDLALLFVIAIGMLLPFIFSKSQFILRGICAYLVGYLFYGIFLTNSRGGMLALMTTIVFFFIMRGKKKVLGFTIGGILAAAILAIGPSRVGIISADEASANTRIELWYGGILKLKANPLFGVGYDMFMDDMPQTAHNSFILIASELGMFGLFFWMGLIYYSIKGLTMVQNKVEPLKSYALGLQSGVVGFAAAAFFLSRCYVILPYMLFALSGALMEIGRGMNNELEYRFTSKDFKITFGLCWGILILAYILIKVGL